MLTAFQRLVRTVSAVVVMVAHEPPWDAVLVPALKRALGARVVWSLLQRGTGTNRTFGSGGKRTKIFYSSKSTIISITFYLSKSNSLKIYSSKSKK